MTKNKFLFLILAGALVFATLGCKQVTNSGSGEQGGGINRALNRHLNQNRHLNRCLIPGQRLLTLPDMRENFPAQQK